MNKTQLRDSTGLKIQVWSIGKIVVGCWSGVVGSMFSLVMLSMRRDVQKVGNTGYELDR